MKTFREEAEYSIKVAETIQEALNKEIEKINPKLVENEKEKISFGK